MAAIVIRVSRGEALIASAKLANLALDPTSLRFLRGSIVLTRKTIDALIAVHVGTLMRHVLIGRQIPR